MLEHRAIKIFIRASKKLGNIQELFEVDFFPILESLREIMAGFGLVGFDLFWILKQVLTNKEDLDIGLLGHPDFVSGTIRIFLVRGLEHRIEPFDIEFRILFNDVIKLNDPSGFGEAPNHWLS